MRTKIGSWMRPSPASGVRESRAPGPEPQAPRLSVINSRPPAVTADRSPPSRSLIPSPIVSSSHQNSGMLTLFHVSSISVTVLLLSTAFVAVSGYSNLSMPSPVGFIGLGIMGEGMAGRLLSEGVAGSSDRPLVVWNRTKSKCTALVEKFPDKVIHVKESAKDVVAECGVTYSILSTPAASAAVFDSTDGVLAGVGEGKAIVDCATLAESDMQRMNEAVVAKGGRFIEAPVSGSKGPAATGTLIFLCAGSKELFDEVVDGDLTAMGKASHFFGTEVGAGTRAKLVVNSLMGTMLAAYSEGLNLAESVGLDGNTMVEVIGQGAIASPMFALKGPKMLVNDHSPNFPLKHASKDMTLASEMAKKAGVKYAVMDQAEELFRKATGDEELNVADEDFSAVMALVQKESSTNSN